jgi:hypothetical protein
MTMSAGSLRSISSHSSLIVSRARFPKGGTLFGDVAARGGIGRHQLANLDAVERPAMGNRDGLQLVEGLGRADGENLFVPVAAGQDELHAHSRFTGTRLAFDEVEAAEDEAAAEDVVQSRQPGRGPVAPIQSSLPYGPAVDVANTTTLLEWAARRKPPAASG